MSTEEKVIKNKVGLLKLAEVLGSVSEACKVMGYSRDNFIEFSFASVLPHILRPRPHIIGSFLAIGTHIVPVFCLSINFDAGL